MAAEDQAPYAAVDVHYPPEGGAHAALVTAWEPRFARIAEERVRWLASIAPYQPGLFYARELPALRAVLADLGRPVSLVIIDGYVDLDPQGRPRPAFPPNAPPPSWQEWPDRTGCRTRCAAWMRSPGRRAVSRQTQSLNNEANGRCTHMPQGARCP